MTRPAVTLNNITEARAFLTSPWPDLLAWIVDPPAIEALLDHGETKASYRNGWAWSIWKDGLHYERDDTWPGWYHRPRHIIPWTDLHQLLSDQAELVARVRAIASRRGSPRSLGWRWFTLPEIIRGTTCRSNLELEREDAYYDVGGPGGYPDRLNAWALAVQITQALNHEPADLIEWAEALA